MYSVTVEQSFVAQHFLTVPDCGRENSIHSHTYTARVEARGGSLNEHNYLVDIVEFEDGVDEVARRYRDETLNDSPRFEGNPSVEQFARVFADDLATCLAAPEVDKLVVSMREDDRAWASYERTF